MEVHAHTHTARKKWTHYFWEFLMLFLAVFCGFLAEYKLEHLIERQKEKQYIKSFLYDLQNDTLNLVDGFLLKDERIKAIDSVFLFFETNPGTVRVPNTIYYQIKRTLWDRGYRRNSTTIDQLKHAGGMRLIRRKNVADSIASYDYQWQRVEFWRETYFAHQRKGKELMEKLIDPANLLEAYRANPPGSEIPVIPDNMNVYINKNELYKFLNFLFDQKNITFYDWRDYRKINESAARLIDLIKKEYHLK